VKLELGKMPKRCELAERKLAAEVDIIIKKKTVFF
jgi:hypothetical protein